MSAVPEGQMPAALARLHNEVRAELASCNDRGLLATSNAKGDTQRKFDLVADFAVRRCLEKEFGCGVIVSEESGDSPFGNGTALYRFIVDPVDGSDNWARGLPLSSVSVAVLPVEGPIALDRVICAMVGGLEQDSPLIAVSAQGAFLGGKRLKASDRKSLGKAFLSCELNHHCPSRELASLLAHAGAVRSYGCASRAVALVATGVLDAHIDVRGRLTPESFLAAARILVEAGGCLVDGDGNPLGDFDGLCQRCDIIAAATPELAREIVHGLAHAAD